jgi:membrane protein implicated in regulation of membrane protease activity
VALLIGGTLAYVFLPFPWWLVVVVMLAGLEFFEFRLWRWAVRQRPRAGIEGIVGERGILSSDGRVRIRGSSYSARVLEGATGEPVIVEKVEGMILVVRKIQEGAD